MKRSERVIRREELYEAVWEKPLSKLTERFGVSDSMLKRICEDLEVPRPPYGYWQKLRAGKNVEQKPLSELSEKGSAEYVVDLSRVANSRLAPDPKEAGLQIVVPEKLTKPHPLVEATREQLRQYPKGNKWYHKGDYLRSEKAHLDIRVTKIMLQRALRIVDALIKALEGRGHKVQLKDNGRTETVVYIKSEDVSFSLYESRKEIESDPKRSYERRYESTGRLLFEIGYPTYGHRRSFNDGKRGKVEDWLPEVVLTMEAIAAKAKVKREEDRVEAEKWRIRQEKARIETEKRERLFELVDRYTRVKDMRTFLHELRKHRGKSASPEFTAWFTWAMNYVSSLDPVQFTDEELSSLSLSKSSRHLIHPGGW